MNVYDYIKNYAAFHGIKEYNLKCRYVTKAQAAETLQFSGGVAFFYRIIAEGEIADRSQLTRKFLEVDTPTDFWDLSPVVEVVDFGTLQKVQTDFIFSADNTLNFKLFEGTADAMFDNMINFCALYMYMSPVRESDGGKTMAAAAAATTGGRSSNDDLIIITD
jgi:hypothetical protein